jgi:hypothetical protein
VATCFTADERGTVKIFCFGVAAFTADGTTDHLGTHVVPAAVRWDPARFERLLER